MYDEFIPFLAQLTGNMSEVKKGYIIDIGANVGDTAAAMIKHTDCNILCVEPTEKFYNLWKQNVDNFGEDYSKRCNVMQVYIAVNETVNFGSNVINGTAIRDENIEGNGVPTYRIDTLLTKLAIDINSVELIKVDTDGYDSEVYCQ